LRPGLLRTLVRALLPALIFVAAPWSPAARAAATSTALFPAGGSAPADQRRALDAALRKALESESGIELMSASETAENIKFMADGGALCTPTDINCLQKFGVIATVDRLLVAEARGRRALEVTLLVVDVASGSVVGRSEAALTPRDADAIVALVRRALAARGAEGPSSSRSATGATEPEPPAQGTSVPAVDETELRGLQLAGAWTAGIGGAVGALGLLGALGGEAVFWTGSGSKDVRSGLVRPLAQTMWLFTIAGAVSAGVGAGLYFAEPTPTPDPALDP
jgi:hypothetical protein